MFPLDRLTAGANSMTNPTAGGVSGLRRAAGALLWLATLGLLAWWAVGTLRVSGDLRLFMPAPRNADQQLLLQELGEGPGAKLLLIALSGAEPDTLAERSRELRDGLRNEADFLLVSNGEDDLDSIPDALQDYRYLLSPGPAEGSLETAALRHALQSRLQDLASPAAGLIAPLMTRDPTLEILRIVDGWTPTVEPERVDGVWFSADHSHALLVAETRAAGFDPRGQQQAMSTLRDLHAALLDGQSGSLEVSGPGAFSERMAAQTSAEATLLGTLAGVGLLLLLVIAYRSIQLPLLGALPLASGAIAGLLACSVLFGEVHGITLAFGFTLLGVAQDYPVHLFSHRRPGESNLAAARAIWPTLAAGAGSSCLAYLVFLFAGVEGLRQLAVFTVCGLSTAALTTRYLLPPLLPPARRDTADAALPGWLQRRALRHTLPRWAVLMLALVCVAMLIQPNSWWQDDLAALTPVPAELLQRDRELRADLAAPDVRWLLVLHATDIDAALSRSATLMPALDGLVQRGVIGSYDMAARYLPSVATQQERQRALPDASTLRQSLQEAQSGLPFKPGVFEPFLEAVERARTLQPLRPVNLVEGALADRALELRIGGLLRQSNASDGAIALISLSGLHDPAALTRWAESEPGVQLLDLKQTAQSLASAWRSRVLLAMGIAAVLLALGVGLALRDLRRAARVLLPVALGTALIVALLHAAHVPLTLFHLVSLALAAGLGVDYALFFEHAGRDPAAQRRTLHSLLVCAASTLLVFALLGTSQIPVLRAIGTTVGLGVLLHFVLSLLLAARPADSTLQAQEMGR